MIKKRAGLPRALFPVHRKSEGRGCGQGGISLVVGGAAEEEVGAGRCPVRFPPRADCRCFIVKNEGKVRFSGSVGVVRGSFSDCFRIIIR